MRRGGLAVINLSPVMAVIFSDLAEALDAADRSLCRGAHNQVVHSLLGRTAVMVTREVAEGSTAVDDTSVAEQGG